MLEVRNPTHFSVKRCEVLLLKIDSPFVATKFCYFYAVSFLGASEKLRKANISFIMSACPFVYIFGKIILNAT
jgi:hypothetical protein